MVLILKNFSSEGPGTIEEYLTEMNYDYDIVDLSKGEKIPKRNYDFLIMMGGPMSVNDNIEYLREEENLVRDFWNRGKKVLGICLGSQIIAKSFGKRVFKGVEEIGWDDIEILEDFFSHKSRWKKGMKFKVFHWHGETFEDIGKHLAKSSNCKNQAFSIDEKIFGVQFHIEMTEDLILDWVRELPAEKAKKIIDETKIYLPQLKDLAWDFYSNFFSK